MRRRLIVALLLAGARVWPQTVAAPELSRALEEQERVKALVEAGAMPRAALEQAEEAVQEARDQAVLRRTLYGSVSVEDLTEEQGAEMLEAAERLLERQKVKLERAKHLVEEGILPRLGLSPYLEELDRRRRTHDLAVSRARLLQELAEMARAEQILEITLEEAPEEARKMAERYDGSGVFHSGHLRIVTLAFEQQFARPLPVSARGDTALHRALGFDHRGRVDVALHPDAAEGLWLRRFLEELRVPYFAFRGYIPGKSTGAHIHIGPPSPRSRRAD